MSCCGLSGSLDFFANSVIAILLYPLGVLAPVPTAVPPNATFSSSFFADTIPSRATVNAVV